LLAQDFIYRTKEGMLAKRKETGGRGIENDASYIFAGVRGGIEASIGQDRGRKETISDARGGALPIARKGEKKGVPVPRGIAGSQEGERDARDMVSGSSRRRKEGGGSCWAARGKTVQPKRDCGHSDVSPRYVSKEEEKERIDIHIDVPAVKGLLRKKREGESAFLPAGTQPVRKEGRKRKKDTRTPQMSRKRMKNKEKRRNLLRTEGIGSCLEEKEEGRLKE